MRTIGEQFSEVEEHGPLMGSRVRHNRNGIALMRVVVSIGVATTATLICVLFVPKMLRVGSQKSSDVHVEDKVSLDDLIVADSSTCGYDLDALNNFDEGIQHMIEAGWRFSGEGGHWNRDTQYRPWLTNFGTKVALPNPKAFWGYDYPGDGFMKLDLNYRGKLTIVAGNAWQRGVTRVSLDLAGGGRKHIMQVPPKTLGHIATAEFDEGDTLVIQDKDQAIIVLNSLKLECYTPAPTPAPPTPDYTTTCNYKLDDLNDFDQGIEHMIDAGWRFSGEGGRWDKDTEYRPFLANLGTKVELPSPKAFWGYDYPGDGYMKLDLQQRGRLTIVVGNAWQRGVTQVSLDLAAGGRKILLQVPPKSLHHSATTHFNIGDTLTIEDKDQAIIVINSIELECVAGPTPAPTWSAMTPLVEGSKHNISNNMWKINTTYAGCSAKCIYDEKQATQVRWWPMHEAREERAVCAKTCSLMPVSHFGTMCSGFLYPTSVGSPRRCYIVLDNTSAFCTKRSEVDLNGDTVLSLCDENLYDFAYHHLMPQAASQQYPQYQMLP